MLAETTIQQLKTVEEPEKLESNFFEVLPILFIAGSGFLVDVYDIVLFSVERIPSLLSLGASKAQMLPTGIFLLNWQLAGMVLGGFIWGILGDKKGRKSALFGSIFLYSLATFFNGFANTIPLYAALRFLAGVGLAGEVGAAMTIASEITPAKHRGYGTAVIRGLGAIGGLLACLIGGRLEWHTAYISAGLAGFLLLFARMSVKEPRLFVRVLENKTIERGSIKLLFARRDRLLRLVRCVLAVIPYWFAFGILVSFGPEICNNAKGEGLAITVAMTGLYFSIGMVCGEILCGTLSQILHSRKLAMLIFLTAAAAVITFIFESPAKYYGLLCLPLGIFVAYNGVGFTTTAEQFGTNLRSTASTIVPNFVRSSAIPLSILFSTLATKYGAWNGAMIAGIICFAGALISICLMQETFARDLNFIEK